MSAQRREWGRLYKQRNSRFWWYRIGFQGRIICQSTKTADKRQAAEVLKRKRQELEAARGGFINMPDFDAKRVTVAELIDALLKDYEVRERRSIAVARSHLKRIKRGAWPGAGRGPEGQAPRRVPDHTGGAPRQPAAPSIAR